eukprot:m.170207 g.170207  ORF g.170207 m.170207 type:complete len:907 (-) comp25143_c0_seq2:122-2842(-)
MNSSKRKRDVFFKLSTVRLRHKHSKAISQILTAIDKTSSDTPEEEEKPNTCSEFEDYDTDEPQDSDPPLPDSIVSVPFSTFQQTSFQRSAYSIPIPEEPTIRDITLRREREERFEHSEQYRDMLDFRNQLPAHSCKQEILETINNNPVTVISGETGCGKTTQVPQFILDDQIDKGNGSRCQIICTQPRRLSAISMAQRVAAERGLDLEPGGDVGYQIRLEQCFPRDYGSIFFCTTGILLRRLTHDRLLKTVSHIIIDEIHERSALSDFLLLMLKELLPYRPDLKLILMSATVNADQFCKYFDNCPRLNIPGFTHPVEQYFLEHILDDVPVTLQANPSGTDPQRMIPDFEQQMQKFEAKLSPKVLRQLRLFDYETLNIDFICRVIQHIHETRPPGAILCFLPGIGLITKGASNLRSQLQSGSFLICPLHSTLSTEEQQLVFEHPPEGVRKIILSTNLAETSITVDDVSYVVDCGQAKEKTYNHKSDIATLKSAWISRASIRQRRGRAGRVKPGQSFHLFPSFLESQLPEYPTPELLQISLEELCLEAKLLKPRESLFTVFEKAISPPKPESVQKAIDLLQNLSALDNDEMLTPLGYHIARLNVDPKIGRMLLFGAIFKCVAPISKIVASLSCRDPFVKVTEGSRVKQVIKFRRELMGSNRSDHLTLLEAIKIWQKSKEDDKEKIICDQYGLDSTTLDMIVGLADDFEDRLVAIGFLSRDDLNDDRNINADNVHLIKAILCAGFYPNVINVDYESRGKFWRSVLKTKEESGILLSTSSALFRNVSPARWLVFQEKQILVNERGADIFAYGVTMTSLLPLLFFGGKIKSRKTKNREIITVDDWIVFDCPAATARLVQKLRARLDDLLATKMENPGIPLTDIGDSLINATVQLIDSEGEREKKIIAGESH